MKYAKTTIAAAALYVSSAMAHMVMNTPTPYAFATLQTAPINGDNVVFPCAQSNFDRAGIDNAVTAGSTMPLRFTGSAVHGGGSCQVSITYDDPPPKDKSKWKVLHTMIGGCPANAVGNIASQGTDANGRPDGVQCAGPNDTECVRGYEVPIPAGIKNGKATIAWTWFNKIGNREMYMNCAPVTVSGGSGDEAFMSSLPNMFVANIAGECTTVEGVLNIPNAGQSVQRDQEPSDAASGTCPKGGQLPVGDAPVPSKPASSAPAASTPAASAPAVSTPAASAPANTGGIFAPGASTTTTLVTVVVTETAAPDSPVATSPAESPVVSPPAATQAPAPSNGNGSCPAGSIPCTSPGAVVCQGTTQYGLCDINNCAVLKAVSGGTQCSDGSIGYAADYPGFAKRSLHRGLHRRRLAAAESF
ncbi:lytic polysaccharide monooxygenase [Patellaria atrata CBS 101060]|uniref:Lytic polysaccharide monooxygenase n=1 Tax=Patellaria atrata CBS 101060 TaxID=1346257 RepID=A0A9P4SEE8_9PEZI|nr:lytic polysaccharide monooxygenase [Patellaria atrata CBS 101060]